MTGSRRINGTEQSIIVAKNVWMKIKLEGIGLLGSDSIKQRLGYLVKKIKLTKGYITLIDDEDYERVSKHSWYINKGSYAESTINNKGVRLHRFILNPPEGMLIDHINGDGLDNRKENLRIASPRQNQANSLGKPINRKSKYKGVIYYPNAHKRKWRARLFISKHKSIHLGFFSSEEEAAKAYDVKSKELYGEFAKLNLHERPPVYYRENRLLLF